MIVDQNVGMRVGLTVANLILMYCSLLSVWMLSLEMLLHCRLEYSLQPEAPWMMVGDARRNQIPK